MSRVSVARGETFTIKFGDGGSPGETFTAKCMINSDRDLSFDAQTASEAVPDCEAPEDAPWVDTIVTEKSMSVSGSGKWDMDSDHFFFDMFAAGEPVNATIQVGTPGAGGPIYSAALVCTKYAIAGTPKQYCTGSLSFQASGAVTRITDD